MHIAIMGSLDFAHEIIAIAKQLEAHGHEATVPYTVARVQRGEITLEEILEMKKAGTFVAYTQSMDLIRWNYDRMHDADAVLIANFTKRGIENYIGGNTFLEIGFAHILQKKIFLWHPVPDMSYTDEILVMGPVVVGEDVGMILWERFFTAPTPTPDLPANRARK